MNPPNDQRIQSETELPSSPKYVGTFVGKHINLGGLDDGRESHIEFNILTRNINYSLNPWSQQIALVRCAEELNQCLANVCVFKVE